MFGILIILSGVTVYPISDEAATGFESFTAFYQGYFEFSHFRNRHVKGSLDSDNIITVRE
jgi:hypothetical protein